ncbi:unnamed protein product (macronuclear) [Paramecium tetraurelia]|uniref:Uncharacterized protein n=1 Tax=Paramecium tetraurelia TaxID=5888 RepID=A0DYW6_PARTE|nr:uncharacterized protein GSPATT00003201001 [Paramecium tetraurelia]CAK88233.1 unnamed protein product [Paramecium tetraurelia]|eukprot:XP_001455630.1 hypothetical protein (macronuclear) [Paramecium tetraurelia strain d4-2]
MLSDDQILQIVLTIDSMILHLQFYFTDEIKYLIMGLSSVGFHLILFIAEQLWSNSSIKITLNIFKLAWILLISQLLYQNWMVHIGIQIVCIFKLNQTKTKLLIPIAFTIHLVSITSANLDYLPTGIIRNCLSYFLLLFLFKKQSYNLNQAQDIIKQITSNIYVILDNNLNPVYDEERFAQIQKEQVIISQDQDVDNIITPRESLKIGICPQFIDNKNTYEFKHVLSQLKTNNKEWSMQKFETFTDSVIIVKKVYLGNDHVYKYCNWINQKKQLFYLVVKKQKKNKLNQNQIDIADERTKKMMKTLSKVSHDMRTPLNAIINMQLCLREQIDTYLFNRYLKPSLNSCRLLLNLVNDILDSAQLQNKKIRLVFRKFNLKRLIEKTISIFDIQKEKKELKIILNYCTNQQINQFVNSDKNRIRQVIMNLLSNAIKYSEAKKIIAINCDYQKINSTFIIQVTDSGLGIKPENLQSLFQEFSRVEDLANRDVNPNGIGLGLLICNELSKLLSSNNEGISVQSEYGNGSTFSFSIFNQKPSDEDLSESSEMAVQEIQKLPESHFLNSQSLRQTSQDFAVAVRPASCENCQGIQLQSNQDIKKYNLRVNSSNLLSSNRLLPFNTDNEKSYQRKSTTQSNLIIEQINSWSDPSQKQPPILIVDDNEFNIIVLQYILEQLFLTCDSAISGEIAIKKCHQRIKDFNQYKIIFLDIEMPVMDGMETANRLLDIDKSLKIVACTGNRQTPEQLEVYKRVGMFGAIEKPVTKANLRDLLCKILESRNDAQFSHYF